MKIVLLPGLDGTGLMFSAIYKRLSQYREVQIVSYPKEGPQDYESLARHVQSVLPQDRDFILVAESFSGPIGYLLAQTLDPHLKAVVFVATFLESPRPVLLSVFRWLFAFIGGLRPPDFVLRKYLLGSAVTSSTLKLFWSAVMSTPKSILIARMNNILALSLPKNILDIPCVYIQAKDDQLVPKRCVSLFLKRIPQLRIYVIEGPHFVLQSNVEECAVVIEREINLLTDVSTSIA